jgi:hypothetical protein
MSEIPLLTLTYKYILPQHSFPYLAILHSQIRFLAAALTKNLRTRTAKTFPRISKSSTLSSQEDMVVNFIVPEVNPSPLLYCNSLPFCKSTYLAFSPSFPSVLPFFKL